MRTDHKTDYLGWFVSIVLIGLGTLMIYYDRSLASFDLYVQQPSAFGGPILILVGIIFGYVAYHNTSYKSWIRRIFERKKKK